VVAVRNDAAAVRVIGPAEARYPHSRYLYAWLQRYEVYEKVRSHLDAMTTPVLLSVGKMEPYHHEDAMREHANGVFVKPFEASDLLATVGKFAQRIGRK
jgi:hypothetical protein